MFKEQVVKELHKPARRNFPRRHTIIKGFDDLWQADLCEFLPYAKENKQFRYVLVVIDCYSKFVWTRALKSKNAGEVTRAFHNILKLKRVPKNLQTDNGKEFYNKQFAALMAKYVINHYSVFSVQKASIAERVIRTLKNALYKSFSMRGQYKWVDILQKITDDYNRQRHSTIHMSPINVKPTTKLHVYNKIKTLAKSRFNIGDVVRISKYKSLFSKGYTPNWSTELFKVSVIQTTNPTTYKLIDFHGNPIEGGFYEQEMQKVKYPDVFLVEKILRKKGNRVYIKWLGLNECTWVDKKDLL